MVQLFIDGGGFMWPILGIFIAGLVFVLERLYHLLKGLSSNEDFAYEIADEVKQSGIDYYSLKEFWYAPNAPISEKASKYGLEGFGNNWKHNTMTSQEASLVKMDIFNEINNCVYLDSDSGLWYLTYLRDQNYEWETIEKAQKVIVEMLRLDNQNKHLQKKEILEEFTKIIHA